MQRGPFQEQSPAECSRRSRPKVGRAGQLRRYRPAATVHRFHWTSRSAAKAAQPHRQRAKARPMMALPVWPPASEETSWFRLDPTQIRGRSETGLSRSRAVDRHRAICRPVRAAHCDRSAPRVGVEARPSNGYRDRQTEYRSPQSPARQLRWRRRGRQFSLAARAMALRPRGIGDQYRLRRHEHLRGRSRAAAADRRRAQDRKRFPESRRANFSATAFRPTAVR